MSGVEKPFRGRTKMGYYS